MAQRINPRAVCAVVATKADLYRLRKIATEDAVVSELGSYNEHVRTVTQGGLFSGNQRESFVMLYPLPCTYLSL